MKSIIWCTKLTILSCILSVGDWKQLTNRTSTSLPTSTQKISFSQLLFFFLTYLSHELCFFFQANNICHLFFQYKWKKLAKKHEQLIQKGFEMFWRRNANLNSIFNYIAIKPCLSWFYFTTISMVTIWPNGIIPCSWNHIYHLVLPRVPTLLPQQVTDISMIVWVSAFWNLTSNLLYSWGARQSLLLASFWNLLLDYTLNLLFF